jgi:hypothetical protein
MDEETIRRIVREEIRNAFGLLEGTANEFPSYESDRLDDAAAHVVERIAGDAADKLKHAPTCTYRTERWGYCNLGCDE